MCVIVCAVNIKTLFAPIDITAKRWHSPPPPRCAGACGDAAGEHAGATDNATVASGDGSGTPYSSSRVPSPASPPRDGAYGYAVSPLVAAEFPSPCAVACGEDTGEDATATDNATVARGDGNDTSYNGGRVPSLLCIGACGDAARDDAAATDNATVASEDAGATGIVSSGGGVTAGITTGTGARRGRGGGTLPLTQELPVPSQDTVSRTNTSQ